MLLTSIEIQGFKSFPDKTSLKFGRGITAVVGPNGSGKSNISDAVRWVLGEQSSRSLRGQKMEDIIFGGTAVRKALGFAEVSLHIENKDRRLGFDMDDVQITRRYYRSGESEYLINRATVRLKDIHELFMDTGLGRDGYSMIGQGKIDSIVASRSEERRDIFEEAAGISRYRYRKQESERRLKAAEENLLRLRDILLEIEARVGPLAQQSEKAQQFLDYSKEKSNLEIGLWLLSLSKFKEQLREQEVKISLASSQHSSAEQELVEISNALETMSELSAKLIADIDETRRLASEFEEEVARTEGEIAVLKNTVFHNTETIERINRDKALIAKSDAEIQLKIDENQAAAETKRIFITEKKNQLEKAQQNLISLQSDNAEFSQKIEKISFFLNELSNNSADAKVKMVTAHSAAQELLERSETAQSSLESHEKLLLALSQESESLKADFIRLDEKAESASNALKGYEYRLTGRRQRVEEVKSQCDKIRLDISEKKRRAQILEDLEKNMEGFASSVKLVMKESSRGILRGIHGPLSRIITVPTDYAVAIEVALGAAMQNIVVGTEEDAKRAIRSLKDQKAGRATFLPLSAIKGRFLQEQGLDKLFGYIGIAGELVQYDSQYKEIINNFLGRVVIAEDLDSAVIISKKYGYKFKVVTLDGQVINSGGSLTGGSLAKSAGLLSRSHEIARYRNEAQKLESQLLAAELEYKSAVTEAAACEADITAARAELAVSLEDKIRIEGEQKNISQQISAQNANIKILSNELAGAKLRLAALQNEEIAAKNLLEEYQQQQIEKEKEMRTLTGGRDELSAGREKLTEEITAIRLSLLEFEKDISGLEESVKALILRRESDVTRAAEMQAEIDLIYTRNVQIEDQIKALEQKIEDIKAKASGSLSEIQTLNQKRSENEANITKLRLKERERIEEREKISSELIRLSEKKESMVAEYDEIIRKLFDEYSLTKSEAEDQNITIEDPMSAARRLSELKSKIRGLGSVNLEAIEEYKAVSERYEFLKVQIDDVEKTKIELHRLITQLTQKMQSVFLEKFETINRNFSETFVHLFGGGTASLRLTEPENVLETGIEIIVQPPGKNISIIEQLSGGEKALIATAIYFAIMKVNPPPFCFLDEVEAALDDVNVTRFAEYLRLMSVSTQFIIITHRRGTMEGADVLYGVTMQEKGVSKLLKLDVAEIEQQIGIIA